MKKIAVIALIGIIAGITLVHAQVSQQQIDLLQNRIDKDTQDISSLQKEVDLDNADMNTKLDQINNLNLEINGAQAFLEQLNQMNGS